MYTFSGSHHSVDERLLDEEDGHDSREEGQASSSEDDDAANDHHDDQRAPVGGPRNHSTSANASGLPKYYHSIRAAKLANMSVRTLSGCADNAFVGIGAMANDPRFVQANTRFSYHKKKNISTSFDISTLNCNTCIKGEHTALFKEGEANAQQPVCFVLTDQNFPPSIPVDGEGECIKVVCVEDGTLDELLDVLLEITLGFAIPSGSVVILFSLSHLAWGGGGGLRGRIRDGRWTHPQHLWWCCGGRPWLPHPSGRSGRQSGH